MSFIWEIKIKGFGPFANEAGGILNLSNSRVAFYAGNGQGKSCISRLFRAAEVETPSLRNSIITMGMRSGEFGFVIKETGKPDRTLHISMTTDGSAKVVNETNYVFHVFNSDYVHDNLAQLSYSPSDDIRGYIVGKDNIDVSEKKHLRDELKVQGAAKRATVDDAVNAARETLANLGISRNITEFKNLTSGMVIDLDLCAPAYDAKLAEYEALRGLPDDIQPIGTLNFDSGKIDFAEVIRMLAEPYTRDSFSKEFVASIRSKQDFIERGMGLKTANVCPFCGREFDDIAQALICQYEEYLAGQEAKTIVLLKTQVQNLDIAASDYAQFVEVYYRYKAQFDLLKPAFTEYGQSEFPVIPTLNEFREAIQLAKDLLDQKVLDISITYRDVSMEPLREELKTINDAIAHANELIRGLNASMQRASTKLLTIKKELCTEMAKKIRAEFDSTIVERVEIAEQYKLLNEEIRTDESTGRRPKKDAVADLFAKLLHEMFGEKYTFDREQFAILFHDVALSTEAERILSDGEKSVLAFCHYIASTLKLLDNDDDAADLFFVIDDPISSLDYHYVYSVAQVTRNLGDFFGISRVRFLVLTHNSAFFNMLARNGITAEHFVFNDGIIDECKTHGIVPYTEHLKDVHAVVLGKKPTHTTGNSIRQIIETLWRFDNPAASNLSDYLKSCSCADLAECEYVYTLCQEQSHGASIFDREQPPDEEAVRRACWAVLNHIHAQYPGQLIATGIDLPEIGS